MDNKVRWLILILLVFSLASPAMAGVWTSPAQPIIGGNNYVFISWNNSAEANVSIMVNITDPSGALKQQCNVTTNEYGFLRCKYNFTSADSSGTWNYTTNGSINTSGSFDVGKIVLSLADANSLTSIKYGQKTDLELNISYEVFMPKEVRLTGSGRDLGSHRNKQMSWDFNNDGVFETLVVNYEGSLYIFNYTAIQEGTLRSWYSTDVGTFYISGGCDIGDFDGDGNYTIICGEYAGANLVAWANVNLSQSNVAPTWSSPDEGDTIRTMPVICDIDRDGQADQVAVNIYVGDIIVYNYTDAAGFAKVLDTGDIGTGHYGTRAICNDFDGDGDNEWLLNDYVTGYYLYDVDPNDFSLTLVDQADDRGAYYGYGDSIDFDNDGVIEAIVPMTSGRYQMLEFNKSGTDQVEEDLAYGSDSNMGTFAYISDAVHFDDLNKNGRPDFAASASTDTPWTFFREYDPENIDWYEENIGRSAGSSYNRVDYADFDGDGIREIVSFARYQGNVHIYQFNGEEWERIYEGWTYGNKEDEYSGDGVRYAAGVNGWLYGNNCVTEDFDNDTREEMICFPLDGRLFIYEQEERADVNVTPKLYVSFSANDGVVQDSEKYTEVRMLNDNTTLCMKQNIALGETDIVDEDGDDQGSISSKWTDGVISTDEFSSTQLAADYATIDSSSTEGAVWSRINLTQNYSVGMIKIWNYFGDGRTYFNVIVNISDNPECTDNESVFDNSADGTNERYIEAPWGKSIYFSPKTVQCVKESTAGSSYWTTASNSGNHRTEIEIYEADSPCSYSAALERQADSSLSVKDEWVVNVTVRDRTGNIINATTNLTIPVTWNTLPFYMTVVGGTEYTPAQTGQIVLQLKDEYNDPVSGATCIIDYYYPNATLWLDDQSTTEISGTGVYYDSFTVPSTIGVYIAIANCTSGTFSDIDSHTFHVSASYDDILGEINQTTHDINDTITNTIIPYLQSINETVNSSYDYLQNTLYPKVNDANGTIHDVLARWSTYNATELYTRINETYQNVTVLYTDTQNLTSKWGSWTAQDLYNISNVTYSRTNEIYADMATASALTDLQTNVSWLIGNVAVQENISVLLSNLSVIYSDVNTIITQTNCSVVSNSDLCTYLDTINSTLADVNTRWGSYNATYIVERLLEINETVNSSYDYLQNTLYEKLNLTWNDTQYLIELIGSPTDDESANTLFGEHAYTQNKLSGITGNLTEVRNLSEQINLTVAEINTTASNISAIVVAINSTVNTISLDVDDLEEMHQCSITPNTTMCNLLNAIFNDTQDIYSAVLSINTSIGSSGGGGGTLFEITSLVAGSPRYPNEEVLVEATFISQNGTATVPDTINMTIYDSNDNAWANATKTDFTQGTDNIWVYTKSIEANPTTGMYTIHLQATKDNITAARIAQFRVATGGPYQVVLNCPTSSAVGSDLTCTVYIEDEGEAATESTCTVWIDDDGSATANATEPQTSFSKETQPQENVTQAVSVNVPSSHATGLYIARVDCAYANSAQPNSSASDSVTLTAVPTAAAASGTTAGDETTTVEITEQAIERVSFEAGEVFEHVRVGDRLILLINDETSPVSKVSVSSGGDYYNVWISVQALYMKPDAVSKAPGTIYTYLDISVSNIKNTDILASTINFKVPTSWLSNNKLLPTNIALMHYKDGMWKKLKTSYLESNDDYAFFSASLSEFSTFAIVGIKPDGIFSSIQSRIEEDETLFAPFKRAVGGTVPLSLLIAAVIMSASLLIYRYQPREPLISRRPSFVSSFSRLRLKRHTNRVIGIMGLKDEIGKTTIAVSIASALAKSRKHVLLVDGNFTVPAVHLHLGVITPEVTLRDVVLGKSHIGTAIHKTRFGFDVIFNHASEIKVDRFGLRDVLHKLKSYYDYIIIDSSVVNEELLSIFHAVDDLFVITTVEPELFKSTLDYVKVAKHRTTKIKGLIVNRAKKEDIERNIPKIERYAKCSIVAVIPEEDKIRSSRLEHVPSIIHEGTDSTYEFNKFASFISGERYDTSLLASKRENPFRWAARRIRGY